MNAAVFQQLTRRGREGKRTWLDEDPERRVDDAFRVKQRPGVTHRSKLAKMSEPFEIFLDYESEKPSSVQLADAKELAEMIVVVIDVTETV